MRVLWRPRRPNQSNLKEIKPEYSLEALVLKLKFKSFGYVMQKADSLEETLMSERLKAIVEGDNRG